MIVNDEHPVTSVHNEHRSQTRDLLRNSFGVFLSLQKQLKNVAWKSRGIQNARSEKIHSQKVTMLTKAFIYALFTRNDCVCVCVKRQEWVFRQQVGQEWGRKKIKEK